MIYLTSYRKHPPHAQQYVRHVVRTEYYAANSMVFLSGLDNKWVATSNYDLRFETKEAAMEANDAYLLQHGYVFLPEKLELIL